MSGTSGLERVKAFVAKSGIESTVRELDTTTRSSALAAQALGCTIAEIGKSVVFSGEVTVVVVISGDRKVDTAKLEHLMGSRFRVASPAEVFSNTGYEIGGVPPFPHRDGIVVIPDLSMGRFQRVWVACGAHNAVMNVSTDVLVRTIGRAPQDLAIS